MPRAGQLTPIRTRIERSVATPNGPDGCWIWQLNTNEAGYGLMRVGTRVDASDRIVSAHRVAYEEYVGPIPDGLVLDHLCRTPPCVNPAHLEPVAQRVNTLRGVGASSRNALKTACRNGHTYSAETMRYEKTPWGVARRCVPCSYEAKHRRRREGRST